MLNRHIVRVCRHCQAPMASGATACWRCGVAWEGPRPATLRLVPSGPRASEPSAGEEATFQAAVAAPRS
jgi:hypothetical protein